MSSRPQVNIKAGSPHEIDLANRLALRPREAAKALGISERAFRDILPQVPHLRAGTAVLVPVDELRNWLVRQARGEAEALETAVREVLDDLHR